MNTNAEGNYDQGLADLQKHVGCVGCRFADEKLIGIKDCCTGKGYNTPPYQSPEHMICRHRREVPRGTEGNYILNYLEGV
jgi:hypothetical protein